MAGIPERPLTVPVLRAEGGDPLLRPWRQEDRTVLREGAEDPGITGITGVPAPYTEPAGRDFIAHQHLLAERGVGYSLAVESGGRAVGGAGLWRDTMDAGRAAVGYWVAPAGRGRGTASRALETLAAWGLGALGLARIEVHIEPWNTASLRVAEKAGFRREGLLRSYMEIGGRRRDLVVWSRIG